MPNVVRIYTDGACSGNPGLFAPEAAELHGRYGSRGFAASSLIARPGFLVKGLFV